MKKEFSAVLLLIIGMIGFSSCSQQCRHENTVIDEEVEPTCTQDGLSQGKHCQDCGAILVEQTVLPHLGHDIVIDPGISPTCMEKGLSEGSHCSRCNAVLIPQNELEKTNHKKSKLLEISLDAMEGISNPGLFHCEDCNTDFYSEITPSDIHMPILSVTGSLTFPDYETKNEMQVTYEDENGVTFDCDATFKIQGGYTKRLPKKNFNMKLYKKGTDYESKQKVLISDAWGKQSKYTLKANALDVSQARNIVTATIFGDMIHSYHKNDELDQLVNGGGVYGFPVAMFQNGSFYGLYTMNTPKDDILFGMDENENLRQAFLSTDLINDSSRLYEPIALDGSDGFEIEFSSTDGTSVGNDWIKESFNNFISFLNSCPEEEFREKIGQYTDVDYAIDQMLLTYFCKANDNLANNINWVTYDGVRWIPVVYDLDGAFGMDSTGYPTNEKSMTELNDIKLWRNLSVYMEDEVMAHYEKLRKEILTVDHVDSRFADFMGKITETVFDTDLKKWEALSPYVKENNLTPITDFMVKRGPYFDEVFSLDITDYRPFRVNFETDGNATVHTYMSENYLVRGEDSDHAYARDGKTGHLDNMGNGEINFKVLLQDGYEIDHFEMDGYDGIMEDPSITGADNIYRLSHIRNDVNVHIITKPRGSI